MKLHLWLFLLFPFGFGCKDPRPESTPKVRHYFIAGTYIGYERGRLYQTWDTLTLTPDRGRPEFFTVTRSTGYQRNAGGAYFPVERMINSWRAVYNDTTCLLVSMDINRRVYFVELLGAVSFENGIYYRLE